jgi:hypothetical protein
MIEEKGKRMMSDESSEDENDPLIRRREIGNWNAAPIADEPTAPVPIYPDLEMKNMGSDEQRDEQCGGADCEGCFPKKEEEVDVVEENARLRRKKGVGEKNLVAVSSYNRSKDGADCQIYSDARNKGLCFLTPFVAKRTQGFTFYCLFHNTIEGCSGQFIAKENITLDPLLVEKDDFEFGGGKFKTH